MYSNICPLVTVITVSFNSQEYISDTIESVLRQSYPCIEHLVIDGSSTDSTLATISKYPSVKVFSEPDNGIYDAMNKGIRLSTGDIIGFLNSDDFFADDDAISRVVDEFYFSNSDVIMAGVCYVNQLNKSKIVRRWPAVSYSPLFYINGDTPAHPGFYAAKSCFISYGVFNTDYKLASDFDLMFRFLHVHVKSSVVSLPAVHMRLGGVTNSCLLNIIRGNLEILSSIRSYGFSWLFVLRYFGSKILKKLYQF